MPKRAVLNQLCFHREIYFLTKEQRSILLEKSMLEKKEAQGKMTFPQ